MKNKINKNKILHILRIIIFVFFTLTILGFVYEKIAEHQDANMIRPPGVLVQVNGHTMHIYCSGVKNDTRPTVILDSGAGDNWESWRKIQPEISKYTRVCSYDRSGLGFSEPTNNSHSNVDVANELAALLKAADIEPPYVLVGHSIGGINLRLFTEQNKSAVAGIVLIDPTMEGMQESMNSLPVKLQIQCMYTLAKFAYSTGIVRTLHMIKPDLLLPYATDNAVSRAGVVTTKVINTSEKEIMNISYDEVRKANSFGAIPMTIMQAKDTSESGITWQGWAEALSKTSQNGKLVTVNDSSHYIQIDQPQIVVESILEIL